MLTLRSRVGESWIPIVTIVQGSCVMGLEISTLLVIHIFLGVMAFMRDLGKGHHGPEGRRDPIPKQQCRRPSIVRHGVKAQSDSQAGAANGGVHIA